MKIVFLVIGALFMFGVQTAGATPTVDLEAQARDDKVAFCVDTVYYNYLKLTGIELRTIDATYVATDTGAEVTGLAELTTGAERFRKYHSPVSLSSPVLHFKCVYRDFMGESMMLTDFDLTEVEGE
jgi:hypothetical protein